MDKQFMHARAQRRRVQNYQDTSLVQQREPDILGPAVQAWRVQLVDPDDRDETWGATIGLWLLHAPEVHPGWEYFAFLVTHLRALPNFPAPVKDHPAAEYEFVVLTLDPRYPLPLLTDLEKGGGESGQLYGMEPVDFISHVGDIGGDARAYDVAERLVHVLVSGALLPDADYRVQWARALVEVVKSLPTVTTH
jgi:hypothetical protein